MIGNGIPKSVSISSMGGRVPEVRIRVLGVKLFTFAMMMAAATWEEQEACGGSYRPRRASA